MVELRVCAHSFWLNFDFQNPIRVLYRIERCTPDIMPVAAFPLGNMPPGPFSKDISGDTTAMLHAYGTYNDADVLILTCGPIFNEMNSDAQRQYIYWKHEIR